MQEAAGRLLGEHDFSAFRAAGCQAKTPIKTLWRADVRQRGNLFIFDFEASAFLHHMVRNLVGSLVYIGKGENSPDWIAELLQMKDRKYAAPTFSRMVCIFVDRFTSRTGACPTRMMIFLMGF